jgi:hypothetical protein
MCSIYTSPKELVLVVVVVVSPKSNQKTLFKVQTQTTEETERG